MIGAVLEGVSTRPWVVHDDLWTLIEPLVRPWPERSPGPRPVADRLSLQGILYVLHNEMACQLLPSKSLTNKGLFSPKRLLLTDSFSDGIKDNDIDDLFSPGDYIKLYNAAFGTKLKASDLNGNDRIIARITRATEHPSPNTAAPADALLRKRDSLCPDSPRQP